MQPGQQNYTKLVTDPQKIRCGPLLAAPHETCLLSLFWVVCTASIVSCSFWVKLFWVKSTLDSHYFPQTYFGGLLTVNHVAQSKTLLWTNHTGGYLPTKIIIIQVRGDASCIWGETFPEMLGFLEQLGCTQPQRPLPLQKGRTRIVLLSMLIS